LVNSVDARDNIDRDRHRQRRCPPRGVERDVSRLRPSVARPVPLFAIALDFDNVFVPRRYLEDCKKLADAWSQIPKRRSCVGPFELDSGQHLIAERRNDLIELARRWIPNVFDLFRLERNWCPECHARLSSERSRENRCRRDS